MLALVPVYILTSAAVLLFFTFKLFMLLISRDRSWGGWYKMVLLALLADILSTCYFVYILGNGWRIETNRLVVLYGPSIGYLNALLLNHMLIAAIALLVGLLFRKSYSLVYIFLYFILIIGAIVTAMGNIVLSTLGYILMTNALP